MSSELDLRLPRFKLSSYRTEFLAADMYVSILFIVNHLSVTHFYVFIRCDRKKLRRWQSGTLQAIWSSKDHKTQDIPYLWKDCEKDEL